jgi:mannitol/fructose-specific phosphotransferase system IIA component (Ntr-type)
MNAAVHSIDRRLPELASVFSRETIVEIPRDVDRLDVLRMLVQSLTETGRLPSESAHEIVQALQERERNSTTGLGKGLALPHLRSRRVDHFVGAVGVAPDGVDFMALDGLPTRLIILLLSPFEHREKHIEIMGRLATLLSDKTLQYSLQIRRSPESLFQFLGFQADYDSGDMNQPSG